MVKMREEVLTYTPQVERDAERRGEVLTYTTQPVRDEERRGEERRGSDVHSTGSERYVI